MPSPAFLLAQFHHTHTHRRICTRAHTHTLPQGRIFEFFLKLPDIELAKIILQTVTNALLDNHDGVCIIGTESIRTASPEQPFCFSAAPCRLSGPLYIAAQPCRFATAPIIAGYLYRPASHPPLPHCAHCAEV